MAKLARHDPNRFIPYVMRDEQTGRPVRQAPYHAEWQQLVTEHDRLVLWGHVDSGKTAQLSIGRVLYELGRNPNLRVVVVSGTVDQARKIATTIAQYIETSRVLRKVFPELLPADPWTTTTLTVKRTALAKDYSIQAIGTGSKNILGARIDLLILDDILDYENTLTEYNRKRTIDWLDTTLMSRLTADARVIAIGNAWHPDDAMYVLSKRPGWVSRRYSVQDGAGNSVWPEHWTAKRIADKAAEIGPLEFARSMLCVPRAEGESRFERKWIVQCKERGRGRRMEATLEELPAGCHTFTGVDLGVKRSLGANLSVLFTGMIHPNDDLEVLFVEAGKWTAPDIVRRIHDTHRRYGSTMLVEDNAAQDFLVQFAQLTDIKVPIYPFHTGNNKNHPQYGVEGIGAELANSQWIIPCDADTLNAHPEIEAWIAEMLYYDPRGHTGDRLMASWIMREGARRRAGKHHRVDYAAPHADMPNLFDLEEERRKRGSAIARAERAQVQADSLWEDIGSLLSDW